MKMHFQFCILGGVLLNKPKKRTKNALTHCGIQTHINQVSRMIEDVTCKRCQKTDRYLWSFKKIVTERLLGKRT